MRPIRGPCPPPPFVRLSHQGLCLFVVGTVEEIQDDPERFSNRKPVDALLVVAHGVWFELA